MRFSVHQESHIGGRKINQDRMGYCFTRDALLLVLADGMGGHLMGEVAASIALETVGNLFQQQAKPCITYPEQFLEDSILAAHREIHRYKIIHNLPDTPRTTIVVCLIQHDTAFWAHCGDSRFYWIHNGELLLRTKDHSRIEALIEQGAIPASERDTHPDRNKLFNCVGSPHLPTVEMSSRPHVQAGDVMLLCSDGLWSVLPEHIIIQCLREHTITRAVPDLLNKALTIAGSSSDNVTALAIMWEGGDDDPSTVIDQELMLDSVTVPVPQRDTLSGEAYSSMIRHDTNALDESEIEKTIEEIRVAIQKSSKLGMKP